MCVVYPPWSSLNFYLILFPDLTGWLLFFLCFNVNNSYCLVFKFAHFIIEHMKEMLISELVFIYLQHFHLILPYSFLLLCVSSFPLDYFSSFDISILIVLKFLCIFLNTWIITEPSLIASSTDNGLCFSYLFVCVIAKLTIRHFTFFILWWADATVSDNYPYL